MTAVSLETRLTRLDIQFVMGNEHVAGVDSIIVCGARDRASAVIHISAGDEQPQITTRNNAATDFADRIFVLRERDVEPAGELTHKESTGVMPSAFVLCVRVAKPDDESDAGHGPISPRCPRQRRRLKRFRHWIQNRLQHLRWLHLRHRL